MSGLRLLNPGPVTLTPRVRAALAGPDLCHREPEFFDMQDRIRQRLLAGEFWLMLSDTPLVKFGVTICVWYVLADQQVTNGRCHQLQDE